MHMFIEKGMHNISMVSKRCKSKLALLYTDDYDPEKYNNYTLYYDAKSLYGWAMRPALPYSGVTWLTG